MPSRNGARSPFAGIGAGHSIVANLVREPASPARSQLRSTASVTNSPRRYDGLPNTDAPTNTLAAFPDIDFTSSSVSDSLSRAFYFDVILEQAASSAASSTGLSRSAGTSAFASWLGDTVQDYDADTFLPIGSRDDSQSVPRSSSGSSITAVSSSSVSSPPTSAVLPSSYGAKSSKVDPARFFGRVQELLDTERSYVKRIGVLHQKYAIPLRTLAKDRERAIIPLYEAQRLFGNIGEIAGANRAFLNDLDRLMSQGKEALRAGLGDVLYNHMSCFSCYSEYFANFEKAKHIEQTLAKHRAFCEFTDRAKYSVTGIGNTGLRDLLMEPIQRIPRYKLLIDAILSHVEPRDPLRSRLQQAITLISRIASCEADDKTRRAAVLWSFSRNVESFPAELISAHRRFIDCIDVDDFPLDASAASSGIAASFSGFKPIHCTLFLFDDRIAIVKRANASTSGRKVVGLEDISKLTSQMKTVTEKSSHGALTASSKRTELAFRGSIGLMDLDAQDLGGTDLQLTLLRQPSHVTGDKWTNRPLRQYVAVDTTATSSASTHASRIQMGSSSLDADVSAKLEKMRFLESVWRAKALYKARRSNCETRCKIVPASRRRVDSSEALLGVTPASGTLHDARKVIYFHLHSRQTYASEPHKTPVALSVDDEAESERTILGGSELLHPHAMLDVSEVDEMEEEFVGQVRTKGEHGGEVLGEPHQLSSADLGDHIAQLSDEVDKRFGSAVRTIALSQPGTPSSSGFRQRTKAAASLENFGRSLLFGASGAVSSISSAGISNLDVFGSPARRSNSNASKSTFSSNAASVSSRAMTMSTAGTSISSRNGAFDALSRSTADSPRSFRRFGRRRSSSVGPPSSTASRCDDADSANEEADESQLVRRDRMRAMTPDPVSLLSTSAGAASPRKMGAGPLAGGRGHVRSRTESAAPTTPLWSPTKSTQAPYQQRQRAESVELCRTPSSAGRRPTGPREQTSPSPAPRAAGEFSPSWMSNGTTTPLNIRRKPAPKVATAGLISESEGEKENDDVATPVRARPASSIGVYGGVDTSKPGRNAVGVGASAGKRRVSGTKRPISSSDADAPDTEAVRDRSLSKRPSLGRDATEPAATLPRSMPLARLAVEEPRPSISSESETSTERGHGHDLTTISTIAPAPAAPAPGLTAPVTPARTSSTCTKSAEARRRNEAMDTSLRSLKEELNLLRCDVEILQTSLSASAKPTPRKHTSSVLSEIDLNAASLASTAAEVDKIHSRISKLNSLFSDLDAKWISSIRMHNRIMHDLAALSSNTASTTAANPSSATTTNTTANSSSSNITAAVAASATALATLQNQVSKLETQLSAVTRKCALLTTLESDGRLENTEIHKAFNEELDLLYDNTQKPESEELEFLRKELKRSKEREHEAARENKRLKRELELEKTQGEAYREALVKHGLL